jgi:hypothetical protein
MSTPSPNQSENSPKAASQSKQQTEVLTQYVVSWKWLIGGVIFLLLVSGTLGGLYAVRTANMSTQILKFAQDMTADAEEVKQRIETENDPAKKTDLIRESFKLRTDAANLLNSYRQSDEANVSVAVLEQLYGILESLYIDSGEGSTLTGAERAKQLIDVCVIMVRSVPDADSIKYRTRLVELEWDRRNFRGILDRGKELLQADRNINNKENYDALRLITMALLDRLPTDGYNPIDLQLPPQSFPREMDVLLKRLYDMKPDDVQIASRYAEFVIDVTKREEFAKCAANDLLRIKTQPQRQDIAVAVINDMVERNKDNAQAYLARYHFQERYIKGSELQDRSNADLKRVLELSPGNPEALILSSRDAFRNSAIAARDGNADRAAEWKKTAEDLLRRTVQDNPGYGMGYQFLGDFLLTEGKPNEAIDVWNQGVERASRWMTEELIGRIVIVLLEQKRIDEAKQKLELLSRVIAEMRVTRPQSVATVINMRTLLYARLYVDETIVAASKMDATQLANKPEEARRLFNFVQQRRGEALQLLDGLLKQFGGEGNPNDYVIEQSSIYYRLLPQSLILAGQLKMDLGIWDSAVDYFQAASPFSMVREQALVLSATAYQQGGRVEDSTRMLRAASLQAPDNLQIRYAYATSLFRSQLSSNATDAAGLDEVKKEFDNLEKHRAELPQPWSIDLRLVHLEFARANLSNSADKILEAQNTAVRKFRELENKTFPAAADGAVRKYSDDPDFVTELVGIYSSLSAIADFDRLLPKLREFPNGESLYYAARVNDSLRRDDREGAVALIEEATSSELMTAAQKQRFVQTLQNLKGEDNANSIEKVYSQLKTTFDQNPDSLRPQAFFILANLSVDREDYENAKLVRDRLEKLEGHNGTMWRYISVRILLGEKTPDFDKLRQIQEEIIVDRPRWDAAYVLRATIEDRFLETSPDDENAKARLMDSLQQAIKNGNMQPAIWARLVSLLEKAGRAGDAKVVMRDAALRGIILDAQTGQFPQPYARMFSQIQESLANEDGENADLVARQCITLAEKRHEKQELLFALNLAIGKAFFDANLYESAKRHLSFAAKRGGTAVYPLAVCMAKSGNVDEGFGLILDEIATTPSAMPMLLPSVLVLLSQVKPTETVYQRIDKLMERVERGERYTLSGKLEASDEDHDIPLGMKRVRTMVVRFPGNQERLNLSGIAVAPPDEAESAEVPAETKKPETPTPEAKEAVAPAPAPAEPAPAEPASAEPAPAAPTP